MSNFNYFTYFQITVRIFVSDMITEVLKQCLHFIVLEVLTLYFQSMISLSSFVKHFSHSDEG